MKTATVGNITSLRSPSGSATSAKHPNTITAAVRCHPGLPVTDITIPQPRTGQMTASAVPNSDIVCL